MEIEKKPTPPPPGVAECIHCTSFITCKVKKENEGNCINFKKAVYKKDK